MFIAELIRRHVLHETQVLHVGGGDLGGHEPGHEHAISVEGAERCRHSGGRLVDEDSSLDVGGGQLGGEITKVKAFDWITVCLTDE